MNLKEFINFYEMYMWNISESKKQIGLFIKLHRLRKKMSQPELANEVDLSKTHISRIENGVANITLTYIIKICNFLEINHPILFQKLSNNEILKIQQEINILEIESKNQKKRKS